MPGEATITVRSPLGLLMVRERQGRIVLLDWGEAEREAETPVLAAARAQLRAYFARDLRAFDLPLSPPGSDFQRAVWRAMRRIPYGRTATYGELARRIGSAPRAVGGASGKNPIPIIVPCHRVLAVDGLGGYSGGDGLATKRFLLALEGGALA